MDLTQFAGAATQLYRKFSGGFVRVEQRDAEGNLEGRASGVIWKQKGIVLTVSQPFTNPDGIVILNGDDPPAKAKVRGWDNRFDLAVLEVEGIDSGLPWGDLGDLAPGDLVFSFGYREIRQGIVALTRESRRLVTGAIVKPWVEVDGTLSHRQNGGGLVSADGTIRGLVNLAGAREGFVLGFAQLENLVNSILTKGSIRPGFLGVRTAPAAEGGRNGLIITQMDEGGPAAVAGLKVGDIILEVEGQEVLTPRQLFFTLRALEGGQKAKLAILRGSEQLSIEAVLGSRPE